MRFSLKHSMKWSIFIFFVTFMLASLFSVVSTTVLAGLSWGLGMLVVFLLILIGIVFDVLGLASAAAKEVPFHAMASEKVHGSKQAIRIVKNADRFSNFCNDVIGDIVGIVSGAASALVVIKLIEGINIHNYIYQTSFSVLVAGLVSAVTVGGKAMGKSFAIHYATEIVLTIGKFFYFLEVHLRIRIFSGKRTKANNGKRGNKRAARTD